jgi:hypothetical protein
MRYFKQLTGFPFKKATGRELWQRRFYDRALRREDTLAKVSKYIFANPVLGGLAEEPQDYPFSGSFVWPEVQLKRPALRSEAYGSRARREPRYTSRPRASIPVKAYVHDVRALMSA